MNGGVSYAKSSRAKNPNPNARSGRRKFNRAVRDYLAHTGNGKPKLAGYKTVTDTLTKNKPRQACILDGAKKQTPSPAAPFENSAPWAQKPNPPHQVIPGPPVAVPPCQPPGLTASP